MEKFSLGILGTSEIAFRRFLPALKKSPYFEYVGIASRELAKTQKFISSFGGKAYNNYNDLLDDPTVDVVYLPLPPALHYSWAKKALEKGKHILVEKPFTTKLKDTKTLIHLSQEKNLAVFENYMFTYHSQLNFIQNAIANNNLGQVRNYRIAFGFPMRPLTDFRYNKELGGGALLDCGGYTIKLATLLLGKTAQIVCSNLNYTTEFDVDLFGTATLQNDNGLTAQISFGMDNAYKCELEIWGSRDTLLATRIFTASETITPEIILTNSLKSKSIMLPTDNQFLNALSAFYKCIQHKECREKMQQEIVTQSIYIEQILNKELEKCKLHN